MARKRPRTEPPRGKAKSYWSELTDVDLVEIDFRTNDPHGQSGIVDELPQTDEVPRVRFAYSVGGKGITCVHPGRHKHGKGVVMEYEDGQRIIVGWVCAKKIWGVDFDTVWKEFDWAEQKAHYLKRRNAARDAGARFLNDLADLIASPAIKQYQDLKNAVRRLPHIAERLDHLFEREKGMLFAEDGVRDHDKEARLAEQQKKAEPRSSVKLARQFLEGLGAQPEKSPEKKPEHQYKTVVRLLGPLGGQDFFRGGLETVDRRLRDLERRAAAVLDQINRPYQDTADLRGSLDGLVEIVDAVVDEIARLEAVNEGFDARNLSRLLQWLNSTVRDGTAYKAGIGTIVVEPNWADPITVKVPDDYRVPSREAFKTFRAAITG